MTLRENCKILRSHSGVAAKSDLLRREAVSLARSKRRFEVPLWIRLEGQAAKNSPAERWGVVWSCERTKGRAGGEPMGVVVAVKTAGGRLVAK
jgi:hypothetical protein